MRYLFLTFMLALCSTVFAQETGLAFQLSGFVKTDIMFDSRQTYNFREGHFALYPLNESLDANKEDINAKANFNMLSIQSRLTGKITGPDAFGAKTGGMVEGEFFGTADGDINGFRLRHAYVTLGWGGTTLLVGQTWNPMFIAEAFPMVVSFNTGAPFQPFSRNPQIRLTHSTGDLALLFALASQRDFASNGPGSVVSSSYLRNSVIPDIYAQFRYKAAANLFGVGVEFKSLTPKLYTTAGTRNYSTTSQISSFSVMGFDKIDFGTFTLADYVVWGGNLQDQLMLGGYGVKSVDAATGKEEYSTIDVFSVWADLYSNNKDVQPGIFVGYSENLGSKDNLLALSGRLDPKIGSLLRVSPRIIFNSGKVRIAFEVEYTSAAFGTVDTNGKVKDTKNIANVRGLSAFYLFF